MAGEWISAASSGVWIVSNAALTSSRVRTPSVEGRITTGGGVIDCLGTGGAPRTVEPGVGPRGGMGGNDAELIGGGVEARRIAGDEPTRGSDGGGGNGGTLSTARARGASICGG